VHAGYPGLSVLKVERSEIKYNFLMYIWANFRYWYFIKYQINMF